MRYKTLGTTEMKVSEITVGTWAIGGQGWGDVDKQSSIDAIREMIDNGVNTVDTAPVYGHGHAEEVVGEAIKGLRSKLNIVTKCGLKWGADGVVSKDMTRAQVFSDCEASLRRLKIDCIDLMFVHWPDLVTPLEEPLAALEELKKQGKIRYIGLSNFSSDDVKKAQSITKIAAIQPQYSMVSRASEPDMAVAKELGIGVLTYGSLGAGVLTGAFRTLPDFEPGDTRLKFYDFFVEPKFGKVMKLLETLDAIGKERGVPIAQVAINWNTQNPLVSTSLLGVRNVEQAKENCAAMDWKLTEQEIAVLNKAIADTVDK